MGVTEVTRGQFRLFVDAEGYRTEAEKDGKGGYGWNERKNTFVQNPRYTWRNAGFEQTDEHPVVNVSWNDAVAFITWMSRKERASYRLPTEAEWEYACRAGSETWTRYCFGDDGKVLGEYAWYFANAGSGTHPVGEKKPNAIGLYDMHGNVWEWCTDWFDADYYKQSPAEDPQGPKLTSLRVARGGGWHQGPRLHPVDGPGLAPAGGPGRRPGLSPGPSSIRSLSFSHGRSAAEAG